ncbi:MAG: PD40 domain-containing protein [Ignavibacteriaceae bacterium]|nr:PD40 domain-containing protein [Ignavibacteriaceae bacterium]
MKFQNLILILFFSFSINIFSQLDDFRAEFEWFTIKGENVEVHFHEGAERTAKVVLAIAEEIWEPVTLLYAFDPGKVHYVIKDIDDYSNGATYFFDNKIEIWTSALDFDLRGSHNWLRNVIAHEFTHMVQIQAAIKTTRSIPAIYIQWLNYEDKRRPDILYGFPNIIASYPLAMINMPAWFAEGTAQYMREEFDYDNWDSHRDMILRSYALDGNMLTWNQMGVFGKTSLGNESVYNSGFALTRYIAHKYGEIKLRTLSKKLGEFGTFTFDSACKEILGISGEELYNEWQTYITADYKNRINPVLMNKVEGEMTGKKGFGNFYPIFNDDGTKIYYISNLEGDYFAPTSLREYDIEKRTEKGITGGIRSNFGFIPGTSKLFYSKLTRDNKNGYSLHDIFTYDTISQKEERLTFGMRANQPSVSKDGTKLVFLYQKDGTTNIGIIDIDGKNFKSLTDYRNGEQVYNPKFSPDGGYIVFDYSYHHGRDIAKVGLSGGDVEFVLKSDFDERNPVFDSNGNIIYASDETGIFNLYQLDLTTGSKTRLTNVTGGAFMPSVDKNGNIAYAGYTSTGYKIFFISNDEQKKVDKNAFYLPKSSAGAGSISRLGDYTEVDFERFKNFNDYNLEMPEKSRYTGSFTRLSIFPFIRFDNYNTTNNELEKIKPGVYLASNDILNRYSLFAGGSVNLRMERDLFLMFEYRNKIPLLYDLGIKPDLVLELYNISRKADVEILIDELPVVGTGVGYNLFEVNLAAKGHIFSRSHLLEFRYIFSSYTATIESFIIPNTAFLYPTTYDTYLIGSNFRLKYNFESIKASRNMEINPEGLKFELKYDYEMNRFNPDGEYTVEDGILKPQYKDYNYHRFEINSMFSLPVIKDHTASLQVRAGTILGETVPDFFDFYLGGLIGMKSYPFYSISGNELLWANLTYRFPLVQNIDARFGHLYFDKIFLSVFGDIGNAWNNDFPSISDFKKGVGAEIRVQMNSFYLFPTSFFFTAAYGFDEVLRETNREVIKYGKEFNFYAGVLFGFDF